ncbi:MAG TPA: hypothetical protein VM076_24720 [Gemmatimonadaceae bacterium]|nr:hypothetical protein [Gemmatimonadaceae bacterium]
MVQSARATYLVTPRQRTELETESWRLLREEWAADPAAIAECEEWQLSRVRVRPQILAWLERFLSGGVGLEQFRATFDRRTRTDWDAFALKGASGAMFLNAIAKHATRPVQLARQLRAALRVPSGADAAGAQLAELVASVAPPTLPLEAGDATRGDAAPMQPTHAVVFATACWHLTAPDIWPAFHPSSRQALHNEERLFVPSGDPVRDYLEFREAFLSLAAALELTVWQLEHLCWWHSRRSPGADGLYDNYVLMANRARRRAPARTTHAPTGSTRGRLTSAPRVARSGASVVRETAPPYLPFSESPPLDHTHVQWLLAKVGHQLGCRVWIAAGDWRREWGGEALGALSIERLPPLGLSPDSQRLVSLIDVVWLTGMNQLAAAFEVEHTTSVYSGLLRMADLAALAPNLNFPLYVVAPGKRLAKVRRELQRPTFRALELDRRCRYFSSESLLKALPSLARWATGPEAIEKLAESAATQS